jgi:hypothetical protein
MRQRRIQHSLFALSGFLGFAGAFCGLCELVADFVVPLMLKPGSPAYERRVSERAKWGYVVIGMLLNSVIWVGAIVLFLQCIPKDLD